MKRFIHIISAVAMLFFLSCGNGTDATDAEMELASKAGRRDAMKAVEARNSVTECEKAILEIRIRETDMRRCGFETCADIYRDAARQVLQDSLIIR